MDFENFEWKRYIYYGIIGIISLIACVFLPMLGSDVGLEFVLPNTVVGWIVYILIKILVAAVNILLFYCFMEQAKLNVKDNENFIKANEILHKLKNKVRLPRSPHTWNKSQYGRKGTTVVITSLLSAFALTNAILRFNLIEMLTYSFIMVVGLIFGIISMKNAECYWTGEYYEYALMVQNEENKKILEGECYVENNKE